VSCSRRLAELMRGKESQLPAPTDTTKASGSGPAGSLWRLAAAAAAGAAEMA
jgi:hypothetical protein